MNRFKFRYSYLYNADHLAYEFYHMYFYFHNIYFMIYFERWFLTIINITKLTPILEALLHKLIFKSYF